MSYFDRRIINVRERPLSEDANLPQSNEQNTEFALQGMEFLRRYTPGTTTGLTEFIGTPSEGFHGYSFNCINNHATTPWSVLVSPGLGQHLVNINVTSFVGTGVNIQTGAAPLVLSSAQQMVFDPPPAAGNSRKDILEVRADYRAANPLLRDVFDPGTETFVPTVVQKTLTWDLLAQTGSVVSPADSTAPISIKKGVEVVGGIALAAEPATSPGYIKIARVNWDASGGPIAALTQDMIVDYRPLLVHSGATVSVQAEIPGLAGSLALRALNAVRGAAGYTVRGYIQNAAVPAPGYTFVATLVLFGGQITPVSGSSFPLSVTAVAAGIGASNAVTNMIAVVDSSTITSIDAGRKAILNGTTPGYTLLGAAYDPAIDQPCIMVQCHLESTQLAALAAGTFGISLQIQVDRS